MTPVFNPVPRLGRGWRRVTAALRGWRPRPLALVAMLAVFGVVVTGVWRLGATTPAAGGGSSPARVGVRDGDVVARYVAEARAELAQLTGRGPDPVYALVTLASYLDPDQTAALVATSGRVNVLAAVARVPLPGRQTELVRLAVRDLPRDLTAAMSDVAARKAHDAQVSRQRAGTEPGRQVLHLSNARLAEAEASAYAAACACVFALVVRATPAQLTGLSGQPVVRAVDPAPEVVELGRSVFVPPLPEQDVVTPPPDEDLDPGDPGASPPAPS
ncbi:MAG TPA: hypothetical protein VF163_09435 [Micromonosporaceae bacterium]